MLIIKVSVQMSKLVFAKDEPGLDITLAWHGGMGEGAESAVMYTGVTCVNTEHKSTSQAEMECQMGYVLALASLTKS